MIKFCSFKNSNFGKLPKHVPILSYPKKTRGKAISLFLGYQKEFDSILENIKKEISDFQQNYEKSNQSFASPDKPAQN